MLNRSNTKTIAPRQRANSQSGSHPAPRVGNCIIGLFSRNVSFNLGSQGKDHS